MTIEELRERINDVDAQLVSVLNERLELAGRVGEYKAERGLPVLDEGREAAVLQKISDKSGRFSEQNMAVYKEIIRQSRLLQEKIKKN